MKQIMGAGTPLRSRPYWSYMPISLLSAVLLALISFPNEASASLPVVAQKKWKFNEMLRYDADGGRKGDCLSFDLGSVTANNGFSFWIRPRNSTLLRDDSAEIKSVVSYGDWSCVEFETGLSGQIQYVWMQISEEGNHGVMASDCSGDEPLTMYWSEMHNAMCGEVPEVFREEQFRFNSEDDRCVSLNFEAQNPQEDDQLADFYYKSWGDQRHYHQSPIGALHSKLGDSGDWTCMQFDTQPGTSYAMWMNPSDNTAFLDRNPSSPPCLENHVPSESSAVE
eukprot:gb/GECG01010519.1/.p1 GENE.gb/GECG01010519.1/~~gb/GECG01010519.1/.p1  ORF type:complete len:280 (+),score=33.28 gb/GECG01010519.1/:1-840(+)